ncbi:MAG: hypothetical protein Q4C13_08320, partial [Clostridia bacterium]|nr:hypothetical protein [Clostridia bacterium]
HGGDHHIEALSMPAGTENAGLFSSVGGGGRVEHVYLLDAEIQGDALAGGIAARNAGTIYKCTVYHAYDAADNYSIEAEGTGGVAGGVAAVNEGEIHSCYVAAGVQATSLAGGVAGRSSGSLRYCEVATALRADNGELNGPSYFGAVASPASSYYGDPSGSSIDANQRWVSVTDAASIDGNYRATAGIAGGVLGLQEAGTVEYCVNAAHVGAGKGCAGGVVGSVYGAADARCTLQYSYNAGWVQGSRYTGGVAAQLYYGTIECCYNTAPVNCFVGVADAALKCYVPREMAQSSDCAGGIVGRVHMNASVLACYNASYVMAAENTPYAGAFGRVAKDSSVRIRSCYFLRNCLNVSERYWLFESNREYHPALHYGDGQKCVSMLGAGAMTGITTDANALYDYRLRVFTDNDGNPLGAGPYFKRNNAMESPAKQYAFPVLNVNTEGCSLGTGFHRTPYYPIRESYEGGLTLERVGNDYVLRCTLPSDGTPVKIRLLAYYDFWLLTDRYYVFSMSSPASIQTGVSGSATLRFTCSNPYSGGSLTVEGSGAFSATEPNVYEITIPRSEFLLSDMSMKSLHAQMLGPTGAEGLGESVWFESPEVN